MRISDWSSDVCSSDLLDRLGGFPTYYSPNGQAATEALSRAFFRLTDYPPEDRAHVPTETIAVHGGRELFVPKSLKGVAVFRSEEHTSELQSLMRISYPVFCLKKNTNDRTNNTPMQAKQ